MQQQIRHEGPGREGARLDHARLNEAMTHVVFGGRCRRVYARMAALSGARPGDRVLDIGCGGGYLADLLAADFCQAPDGTLRPAGPVSMRLARRRPRALPHDLRGEGRQVL